MLKSFIFYCSWYLEILEICFHFHSINLFKFCFSQSPLRSLFFYMKICHIPIRYPCYWKGQFYHFLIDIFNKFCFDYLLLMHIKLMNLFYIHPQLFLFFHRFCCSVSHNLMSPLAMVLWYCLFFINHFLDLKSF